MTGGAPRTPAEQAWWQARRAPWQAQMGEAAFEQAARQGQAMELRAAVREARERLAAITALTPPTAAPVPGAAQARVALAT